ncbi:ABC transporter permease subunit [Sodalis sp. dw_96]|uniref:ABC transporter permease n=1 Tax=Sodalis sp. dw_96 TaxID=2719794 RepID=UPI001BD489E8|nr:ABC transporter permease subunit [Sodalis sp. dw_96]
MNAEALLECAPAFLWRDDLETSGLALTARLFLLALIPGSLLSIVLAVLQAFGPRPVAWLIKIYSYFFRGTPLYLQLMLIYYGLSQFGVVQEGWCNANCFWLMFRNATFCAVLALTLNMGAYVTELMAGMMATFPRREWVAAEAFGMSRFTIIRRLVVPATLRRGIPALCNELVFLLHATSLASTVTLMDITGVARSVYSSTFSPFIPFLIAAALYLLCTFLLLYLCARAEHKWLRFQSRV